MVYEFLMFFLVFLGGLLVVFIYVSSLIPQPKAELSFLSWLSVKSSVLVVSCFFLWGNFKFMSSGVLSMYKEDWSEVLSSLSSTASMSSYLFVVIYLFFALYVVCYLLELEETSLRGHW